MRAVPTSSPASQLRIYGDSVPPARWERLARAAVGVTMASLVGIAMMLLQIVATFFKDLEKAKGESAA